MQGRFPLAETGFGDGRSVFADKEPIWHAPRCFRTYEYLVNSNENLGETLDG